MADTGGYEYDFVDVPPDRVICKICHNPCRDVHLTGCCGAHFCLACLQQLKKGTAVNKACPMCRVEKFKIFPNKQLDREIKALKVFCVNRRSGCTWSGEINNMKKHISTDCLFVDVFCPSKCGLKLKRQCVELHLSKECPCHCQHCGATGHKEEISKRHKKHCIQYPIPCPNGCDSGVVPSIGMDTHRQICPLEMVHCEFFNIGCNVMVTRIELEDHYRQNVAVHLHLTCSKLSSVTEEMGRTEKKMAMATKELESMKLKYSKLEGRITNVKKEMNDIKSIHHPHAYADEVKVPQPITDCAKRKFFECRLSRLAVVIFCILTLHIIHVNVTNDRLSQTEQYTWPKTLKKLSNSDQLKVAPVTFKIPDYRNKLGNDETWTSPPFFAFQGECKTWLTVDFHEGNGLMVSLKSSLEETCFLGKDKMFTIELLNQLYNGDHYVSPFLTDNSTCHVDDKIILCTINFVSDRFIERKSDKYLKNGNVYLRITHDRNIFNYLYWFIRMVIGSVKSTSEYHAYILWLTIAIKLLLEVRETFAYEIQIRNSGFPLLDKIFLGMSLIGFVILFLYMFYCIGLLSL